MFDKFKDKNVLITGHTGFKGSWLCAWMKELGANVAGISLDTLNNPSHFVETNLSKDIVDLRFDIRDKERLTKEVKNFKPNFVFHLAAQSLVRKAYEDPLYTWETNLLGTINLLDSLKTYEEECVAIFITSDKCYDNLEWVWGYREEDKLGGPDPYSASKGAAELAISSYFRSYFRSESKVRIASVRAGNVIGGGDWSEDRIVPDCVRAWSKGQEVILRNPSSTRPWQHVLEPLSGYIKLASILEENPGMNGESFNFGPAADQNFSVGELVLEMSKSWDKVSWKDVSQKNSGPYESSLLKLNCDKALSLLDWKAILSFEKTVGMTAWWYREFYNNPKEVYQLTASQIREYENLRNIENN